MGSLGPGGIVQFNLRAMSPACYGDVSRTLVAAGSGEVFPERLRAAGVYRPVAT